MFMSHEVRELLQANVGRGLFAVSIEHDSGDLYYSTGNRGIEISGQWYEPRGMTVPELNVTTGGTSARIAIADTPDVASALERLHYSSRFSGGLMWWYFYVWADDGTGWNLAFSYAWTITQCSKSERSASFEFILSGATGTYPRAALEIIGRGCGLNYGNALCGGAIGDVLPAARGCDGSMADCVLREREDSYRGAILAPEQDHEIEFYYRQAPYSIAGNSYIPPPPPGGEDSGSPGSDTPAPRAPAGRSAPDDPGDLNMVDDYVSNPSQEHSS